jgi:Cu/Ag efflux protein CusF
MRDFIFLIIICSSLFSACQQSAPETKPQNKPQNARPTQTSSATPAPATPANAAPTSTPDRFRIQNYNGRGTVTKINLEMVSVELNHEEIEGLMPAMRMEFFVKEKTELEKLSVGDKVEFVLEYNAGAETIIRIKKAP